MIFSQLRLMLQEKKKLEIGKFLGMLDDKSLIPKEFDLLLRKAIEEKVMQFSEICSALVMKGANLNFYDLKDEVSNLMLACEKGSPEMVEILLSYKGIDLMQLDKRKLHAGFRAIENKSKEDSESILKILVQAEPNIIHKTGNNQSMLTAAIGKGRLQLVKMLLEAGADPNWQVPDTGNTSLHDAVKQLKNKNSKAMTQIIRMLLMKGGDSTIKNKQLKNVYDYAEKALADYRKLQEAVTQQLIQQQQKVIVLYQLNNESQFHTLLQQAHLLFQKYEVDSEDEQAFISEKDIHTSLTDEILAFERQCKREHNNVLQEFKDLIQKLDQVVETDGYYLQTIGSFATGLWVKHSNIDLQLTRKDPFNNKVTPPQDVLTKLVDALKKYGAKSVSCINRQNRSPIVRGEVVTVFNSHHNLQVAIADRNQTSKSAVTFILQQMRQFPELSPMFFVLKILSYHFHLNDPKNGGIRTYALVVMLLSCISKWNTCDLGKLLIDFLFYFGFYYEYGYEMRGEAGEGFQDYAMVLSILDPMNPNNNLANNVRVSDLQKMFRGAYISLHSNVGNDRLRLMFDTKRILID